MQGRCYGAEILRGHEPKAPDPAHQCSPIAADCIKLKIIFFPNKEEFKYFARKAHQR